MTLSLALAAERGRYAVICCDGRLMCGSLAADVSAPKFQWFGEWVLLFAGELASTDLVVEELRQLSLTPQAPDLFSRKNILRTLRSAFNNRAANWSALRHVSMFHMDAEEFKDRGLTVFGEKMHRELVNVMHNDAQKHLKDQIMVVGWGKEPISVLIHSVSIAGDKSHNRDGHGAIGTGAPAASDALFRLEHGLWVSLQDAICMAAFAKFASQAKTAGKTVGKNTTICITRKRLPSDDETVAIPVQQDDVAKLREIWTRNKNARSIPLEARQVAAKVVELTGDKEVISRGAAELLVQSFEAMSKRSTGRTSKGRQ